MGKIEVPPIPPSSETSLSVIGRILNECQHSQGIHARRAKELIAYRSQHRDGFLTDFWKCLIPIFTVLKREPTVERLIKFVITFVTLRDDKHGPECDTFLEEFFGLLLFYTDATNKAVRLRACQILSEIILKINEEAEVSDEVWDDVIKSMCRRMQDKVPAVRVYSVRALARFASADSAGDPEEDLILSTYRKSLELDQNAEVRKNVILSMPASNSTVHDVVAHTADANEGVRKAAFFILAKKFPIQSLSIKQRTIVLQRGLHDRKDSVKMECLKMLKDAWLIKCCQGDPISLLKYLDVETNEAVGESVMLALLNADVIKIQDGQGFRKFIPSSDTDAVNLMEAEEALHWRMVISNLHSEAQSKGHDAATTGGAQAAMNAAAATEKNELLDKILPPLMSDYVSMVKAHIDAGVHLHFVSRQLLLVGKYLDFSDVSNRKVAGQFLQEILCLPAGHIEIEHDAEVLIGDGLSLGGDRHWTKAVTELAWKVHETPMEFAKMVCNAVAELGRPCREGGASLMQWVNCLAATGFLLENIESVHQLNGYAIDAHELLGGILLPAAKHIHPEVQRSAVRSLGLFCTKEAKPSLQALKQIHLALIKGISTVKKMATRALFDLCMWHGADVVDRVIGYGMPSQDNLTADAEFNGYTNLPILEELAQKLDVDLFEQEAAEVEAGGPETVQGVIAEGFAKLLLQSKVFSDILPLQHSVLSRILRLYFSDDTKDLPRLRQCLAVFFETYPSMSLEHKNCIMRTFIPVVKAEWPGIYGNESGAPGIVAAKKRHATRISKFVLQMLRQPLFEKETTSSHLNENDGPDEGVCSPPKEPPKPVTVFDEELAVRIAVEIVGFPCNRSAVAKSYLVMLIKTLSSLEFRKSEQELIKSMRKLLQKIRDSIQGDKQAIKEIENMAEKLRGLDDTPDDDLSEDQLQTVLSNREIDVTRINSVEQQHPVVEAKTPARAVPKTPATNRGRGRRRVKRSSTLDSSDSEGTSPAPMLKTPVVPPPTARAQRASKTAAMGKLRSELVPSKRTTYASSGEDLSSSSEDEDDEEDEYEILVVEGNEETTKVKEEQETDSCSPVTSMMSQSSLQK